MRKLAGEILTGIPMESYSNDDMDRGREQEPEILARYAFEHDIDVAKCGFIRNGKKGCSPDGLIGDDGMVQIKSAAPHVMIEILEAWIAKRTIPTKHLPQCQGELWVAERKMDRPGDRILTEAAAVRCSGWSATQSLHQRDRDVDPLVQPRAGQTW
jgi:hypothetical protein